MALYCPRWSQVCMAPSNHLLLVCAWPCIEDKFQSGLFLVLVLESYPVLLLFNLFCFLLGHVLFVYLCLPCVSNPTPYVLCHCSFPTIFFANFFLIVSACLLISFRSLSSLSVVCLLVCCVSSLSDVHLWLFLLAVVLCIWVLSIAVPTRLWCQQDCGESIDNVKGEIPPSAQPKWNVWQ